MPYVLKALSIFPTAYSILRAPNQQGSQSQVYMIIVGNEGFGAEEVTLCIKHLSWKHKHLCSDPQNSCTVAHSSMCL